MNELYCKNCGEYIGKSGKPDLLPDHCPQCEQRFFPDIINSALKWCWVAGGGQYARGRLVRGSVFGSFAFCGLFFGSLMFPPIGGILIAGFVAMAAFGDTIQIAENDAGFVHHQKAV